MRVIIAGSRNVTSYTSLLTAIRESNYSVTTVISGGAKGVDSLGETFSRRSNILLEVFKADWDLYGKRAGMIRNSQMAESADALIAIWDGASPGTRNMIKVAKEKMLKVYVKYIE